MANCTQCGGKLGIFGGCSNCNKKETEAIIAARIAEQDALEKAAAELEQALSSVIVTTEQTTSLNITKRFGVIMSSVSSM